MKKFPSRRPAAFTLIELLITVGIISVLTALLLANLSSIHRQAEKAACINNLRQIGIATGTYIADNDNYLPHYTTAVPVPVGQPAYNQNGNYLSTLLSPYLGISSLTPARLVKSFVCPGWQRFCKINPNPDIASVSYIRVSGIAFSNGVVDPCGGVRLNQLSARAGQLARFPDPNQKGLNTAWAPFSLSTTWFLQDCDQLQGEVSAGAYAPVGLPPVPVHGNARMSLFLDLHVGPSLVSQ